ncbi:hypothetical protein TNCV_795331 [Trichonephila clavipes]|nr:hypothetical protein TNCV_795331 [Trichonephila clavipes]
MSVETIDDHAHQLCPNGLLTNVVVKHAPAAAQCVHKQPSYTIDAYTVRCQYRSDFIVHLHNFNCPSCRCTGTVVDPLGYIHSFTFPALHDSPIWSFIGTVRLLLRRPSQHLIIFIVTILH